jgi:tetratricopeptide (TPR) repeat protein
MASKQPPVAIPRVVRDTLYAPECPSEAVAVLVDVALTHHNAGRFDAALEQYAAARVAWEDALLATAVAEAGLDAIAAEAKAKPWVLTGEEPPETPQPATRGSRARRRQQQEAEARAAEESAEGSDEGGDDDAVVAFTDPAAEAERERQIEALRAIYATRPNVVPAERSIFLHLATAAVHASAQRDGDTLAELGIARRLLVSRVPVFHVSLLAANVYAALGCVHYHLSQFDFAGDYFFRCLESREQLCGADHIDTAAAMNNVGAVLYVLGKSADSLALFNRALAVADAQSPPFARRDLIDTNVRIAKGTFFNDAAFPAVPFTPYVAPLIPGAIRAKQFKQPKAKKKTADDAKGKGKK